MTYLQILSGFRKAPGEALPTPARTGPRALVFDTCEVGVVFRAVVFVEAVAGVATLYAATSVAEWFEAFSLLTCGALTGTLAWLISVCALKRLLARLPQVGQHAVLVSLGGLAGLGGCALLGWTGLLARTPWLASAATGVMLSGLLAAALVWRARGRLPADTAAQLAELQARIRPHFLFNTLNSAMALVRAEPARAEALLEDLSELFRHALAGQDESTTLAQEVSLARRYLAIEQVRFGPRLRLELLLDSAASGARLPPLLLQPLVENAVRHGVQPSPSGADLCLMTERRGNRVVITISNTVPAGPGEPGMGLALDNARHRLHLLHDLQGSFMATLHDGVFLVRIEIPAAPQAGRLA